MKAPTTGLIPPIQPARSAAKSRAFLVKRIALPTPTAVSTASLASCLSRRRSVRDYGAAALDLESLSQLLWAAQGVTAPGGLRTAPSAGAIYPLRAYVIAGNVDRLAAGVYQYDPDAHELMPLEPGDKRKRLAKAAGGQDCVESCAAAVLLTAWYRRIQREFGEETGTRLAAIEAGHIGQNFCLQATALGLGAIGLGKLDEAAMKLLLPIPQDEEPIYMMLSGRMQSPPTARS
jgi:SagB-type dehydrogenase family enzyme